MRNKQADPATSGTMKMLEAIIKHSSAAPAISQDEETRREAKRLDEKAEGITMCSKEQGGSKARNPERRYLIHSVVERSYFGKQNQKRKGHRRNNEEARALRRLDRKG